MTDTSIQQWEELTGAGKRSLAQGDDAQAEEHFRAAVALAERLPNAQLQVAHTLECLARLKFRQQRHPEAQELFRRALGIQERTLGPEHPSVTPTLNGLAAVYAAGGRHAEAEGILRRALAAAEQDPAANHRELTSTLNALARHHFRQQQFAEAEPLLLRLLDLKQEVGKDNPEVAAVLTSLAALRSALGRHDHAEQLLRRALAIREAMPSPNEAAVAMLRGKIADALAAQGRAADAATARKAPADLDAAPPALLLTPVEGPGPRASHRSSYFAEPEPDVSSFGINAPRPSPALVSPPRVPDGAALFAAAAALALDEIGGKEPTPGRAQTPARRFDPNAPLWPTAQRRPPAPKPSPAAAQPARAPSAPLAASPFTPLTPLTPLPVQSVADESPYANIVAPAPMWPSATELPAEQPQDLAPLARAGRGGLSALRGALPKLEMPRIALPKVAMPRVALPSISLPRVRVSARHLVIRPGFKRLVGVSAISLAVAIAAGLLVPVAPESGAAQEPQSAVVAEVPTEVADALDDPAAEPQLTGDAVGWAAPAPPAPEPATPPTAEPAAALTVPVPDTAAVAVAPPVSKSPPKSRQVAGVPRVRVDVRAFDERLRASTSAIVDAPPARLTDFKKP